MRVEGHRNRIECEAALDALAGTSLWLSPRVLQEARTALGEIFA